MVSKIFYFYPYFGKGSDLTFIFLKWVGTTTHYLNFQGPVVGNFHLTIWRKILGRSYLTGEADNLLDKILKTLGLGITWWREWPMGVAMFSPKDIFLPPPFFLGGGIFTDFSPIMMSKWTFHFHDNLRTGSTFWGSPKHVLSTPWLMMV